MNKKELLKIGYDERIESISTEYIKNEFTIARIIEVNKNRYTVSNGCHEMPAELCGKFLFDIEEIPSNFPTVGDWVAIQALSNNTLAIIHSVLPRKTLLKRKEAGKKVEFQLIAANIDIGLVVQSANQINLNLLDRYCAMLYESSIQPLAVFTKKDLLTPDEISSVQSDLAILHMQYVFISNAVEGGEMDLSRNLSPRKTYCLLGKSGVGKTSILNRLLHSDEFKVNDVREKDGKGRHTTTKRQLVCLDSGSIFIDTPGMRELGNFKINKGIDETFEEFSSLELSCYFRNCTHTHEGGCAVLEAISQGKIEQTRYDNFLKLKREAEFYDMSYQEKRHKDKSFGKMIKQYKKFKKHR